MEQRTREQVRNIVLCVALVAAIGYFLQVVDAHCAVRNWLCWRFLGYWVLVTIWGASCLSGGTFLLRHLQPPRSRVSSEFALAFPLGVFAFAMGMFLLGLLNSLNTVTFAALPAALLLLGANDLYDTIRLRIREAQGVTIRSLPFFGFGLLGIGLLYFQILTPQTLGHDARWYHIPLGQQYAYRGSIGPWPEGWWLSAYPHLASLLYAWAFLTPNVQLFDKYELCSHLEFLIFLATLASIPSLVRELIPSGRARWSWVTVFLFPGIFLYDANLNGAADHIAALWAVPIALATLRLWNRFELRNCMLWAVYISAATLTKYMALCIVVFPLLAFVFRFCWLFALRLRSNGSAWGMVRNFLLSIAAGLALTSPHWLKNWLWYGDPFYPVLHDYLPVHPWNPDAPAALNVFASFLTRPSPGWAGVIEGLKATLSFSFNAIDWWNLHRDTPVFGSLFGLSLICLPFLGATRRLLAAYAAVMIGVFVWYMMCHQERYLQIILPWIAAAVAAAIMLMWQTRNELVRMFASALVGLQLLWGLDVPFFPTNNLTGDSSFRVVSHFLAWGFMKVPHRTRIVGGAAEAGVLVPRDARVLLHNIHPYGFDAEFVSDLWQGKVNYGRLGTPTAIQRELQGLGVTHVAWETYQGLDWTPLAHDMAFANFALNYVTQRRTVDAFSVGQLPSKIRNGSFNDRVAAFTCGMPRPSGWYTLDSLLDPKPGEHPRSPDAMSSNPSDVAAMAGFLLVDERCLRRLPDEVIGLFHPPVRRGDWLRIYVRRVER